MGRAWFFRLAGTHTIPWNPSGAAFTYGTTDDMSAVLSRRIARHFAISGAGRYRRLGARGLAPDIESYQVGLFVSFADSTHPGYGGFGHF